MKYSIQFFMEPGSGQWPDGLPCGLHDIETESQQPVIDLLASFGIKASPNYLNNNHASDNSGAHVEYSEYFTDKGCNLMALVFSSGSTAPTLGDMFPVLKRQIAYEWQRRYGIFRLRYHKPMVK